MRRPLLAVAISAGVLATTLTAASAPASAAPAGVGDLKTDLDNILSDPQLANAQAGVVVRSAQSGEVLYSRDANRVLVPSSNTKLFTSAAAFETLGSDYKFRTSVLTKSGDLYLKGTGDPSLHDTDLDGLAAKVAASGAKTVRRLVADDTWFDDTRLGPDWTWDDEPNNYSAPVSALTVSPDRELNAGSLIVEKRGGSAAGQPVQLKLIPETDAVKIDNRAVTGSEADISVDRQHGSNVISVTGRAPVGAVSRSYPSVWDATGLAADVFRRVLKKHGVRVYAVAKGATPSDAKELATHDSEPLSAIAVPFLKLSNNNIAEILVKSLGRKTQNKGDWSTGLTAVSKFLANNGITGQQMHDGSGLSRANFISPELITKLLATVRSKPWFTTWYEALPIAGNPDPFIGGTLAGRMRGTPAANNVHAKTGTLTGSSNLSGYVKGADGEQLIFSIMMNNYLAPSSAMRGLQDSIAVRLAQFKRGEATGGSPLRIRAPQLPVRVPGGPDPKPVECSWLHAGC